MGKIPAKFNVTTVTSSLVEGIFKNRDNIVPNTSVSIDKAINSTTDDRGGFFFDDVKWGPHVLELYLGNSTMPYTVIFPIQRSTPSKDLGEMSVNDLLRINSTSNVNSSKVTDKSKVNPEFKESPIKIPINYTVALLQQAKKVNKNYLAKISLQVQMILYQKLRKYNIFFTQLFTHLLSTAPTLKMGLRYPLRDGDFST